MKTYALAGAGARGLCFARAILEQFGHVARLVALFDHNTTRMRGFCAALGSDVPCYSDFAAMTRQQRPDVLIICTPDHTHDDMVELAFRHGMDAVCEKPMATTAEKVLRILALEQQYGRRVRVTFNLRYATFPMALKKTLLENDIGAIRSVHLEWFLDKVHGAEYFRRWHRNIGQSGGLLVHKATHHFDYVNWLLGDQVTAVAALGALRFYGRNGSFRGERCSNCEHAQRCPFFLDTSASNDESINRLRSMYLQAEHEDGYLRDRCIFGEDVDIYDTMSVLASFRGGAQMSYSLTAYAPCEGYRMVLTGTQGRIEAEEFFGGILLHHPEHQTSPIRIIRGQTRKDITINQLAVEVDRSDHGGGDYRLCRDLFEDTRADPLHQKAGSLDGAASCLVGICANQAIQERRVVELPDLGRFVSAAGVRGEGATGGLPASVLGGATSTALADKLPVAPVDKGAASGGGNGKVLTARC